jgi:glutamate--cysteine ligase
VVLTEAMLLKDVRERLFSALNSGMPRAVGLELELIPILRSTRKSAPPVSQSGPSTSAALSRLGTREGWIEQPAGDDPSAWLMADGARISFEPGGQIEISTAPHASASPVIDSTRQLASRLRATMAEDGIDLVARGVDPYNDVESVRLQLHRERYTGMTRFFDSIGPAGRTMMRQTAALQISVERGEDPLARWRLLNALVPFVVALFANSRQYAGRRREWASYRSHLWQVLDPSRTGIIFEEEDPAAGYLRFALDAKAMRAPDGDRYLSFREWMRDPAVDRNEWIFHLSTLFPEVRAREFFELRSADTIEPEDLAAPVVFVTALIYDDESARRASTLAGHPSNEILERAGRLGLSDPSIRSVASELVDCCLNGARRLGYDYITKTHIDESARYFARALDARDI